MSPNGCPPSGSTPPGHAMYALAKRLFPICRSITGNGFRRSLEIIAEYIPGLKVFEVPSGTQVFDWTVPKEWNIRDAYVIDPSGKKIIDFKNSNLHVMGYSTPVDQKMSLDALQGHLYSLPEQPDAIPYITSYYKERWGICLSENQRRSLSSGEYHVVIDSELKPGSLTYGEVVIPGSSEKEIFISTYLCHPSMANDELSGPVVVTELIKYLFASSDKEKLRYTYRFVLIPETIGSITYLSRNLKQLQKNVIAGFNISCVGDNRCYSYLSSRAENTLADRAALHALKFTDPNFKRYSFLDRGSDERQYCAPGIDLPVCCITRSKINEYPEYHTSLDDLNLISSEGLQGSFDVILKAFRCIELNEYLKIKVLGEPQLGKRGMYPTISTKDTREQVEDMMNFIAYLDGRLSTLEIADKINTPLWSLEETIAKLKKHDLVESVASPLPSNIDNVVELNNTIKNIV